MTELNAGQLSYALGKSVNCCAKFRSANRDFPRPIRKHGNGMWWSVEAVRAWLTSKGMATESFDIRAAQIAARKGVA